MYDLFFQLKSVMIVMAVIPSFSIAPNTINNLMQKGQSSWQNMILSVSKYPALLVLFYYHVTTISWTCSIVFVNLMSRAPQIPFAGYKSGLAIFRRFIRQDQTVGFSWWTVSARNNLLDFLWFRSVSQWTVPTWQLSMGILQHLSNGFLD